MAVHIKLASEEDAAIVRRIMLEAFEEYRGKLNPPSGALKETVDDVLGKMRSGGAVIAWNGAEAVGSARYEAREGYIYIGRVSVLPAHRGKGIGKRMLEFIETIARTSGIYETRVGVRLSIPGNVEMYGNLGYGIVNREYYPEKTDSWYVMSKRLL
ncbi:GNAT family N-acetyltransferase [Paenibacillus hamazuiensis]|uniref:GNAT family N-acetyltransferase n=1 Tax=Paenibacillus hamazuiensis TaxID=2936508 RepID=UPI00200EA290|nr:GNAT family N-acetyltransferase [Paenibacillus hamazuiensis]